MKSTRQIFKKFGPYLRDPETEVEIIVPKSLPTIHQYNTKETLPKPTEILEQT